MSAPTFRAEGTVVGVYLRIGVVSDMRPSEYDQTIMGPFADRSTSEAYRAYLSEVRCNNGILSIVPVPLALVDSECDATMRIPPNIPCDALVRALTQLQ